MTSNENKMSDGGRERPLLGVNVWKSSQEWSAQRSAVRSIARLCNKSPILSTCKKPTLINDLYGVFIFPESNFNPFFVFKNVS